MNVNFKNKCIEFANRLNTLHRMLEELKQRIILQELSKELGVQIKAGRHLVSGHNWLEETDIAGEAFTLINKSKGKYSAYVIYTKKEYNTVGLGFMYKDDVISPHIDSCVDKIIENYSNTELDEIAQLIDDTASKIVNDIDYINANPDIHVHEHYYGEYNKGFESHYRYETISDVINDYKKR